jgi:hypothetical protein
MVVMHGPAGQAPAAAAATVSLSGNSQHICGCFLVCCMGAGRGRIGAGGGSSARHVMLQSFVASRHGASTAVAAMQGAAGQAPEATLGP